VQHVPRDTVRVTEGELKADVATNLSGILTVSVPGVSAWRGVIPVLAGLAPRTVHLAFDADAATNPLVARAAEATAKAVALEGYDVLLEGWDRMLAKGIDDALVAELPIQLVPVQVLGHSDPAEPIAREVHPRATGRHAYKSTQAGLIWERPTQNGPVVVPLTNFRALIATDVLEDDGAEVRRRFELEARLNGWCRRFTVTAEAFAAMGWVTEHLGARAIVYPGLGLRDHARAAVQVLSGEVPERHVYSHTGWRQLPGGWAYLHGRGAIGPGGPVPGVEVDLPDALTGFALPDPPSGAELVAAVRASLRLVDVAPDHIAFPLLGAAYRAVLGEVEFALHLAGPTGVGKSELAALIQRHFGPDLDARHLPGYWSSTANALELLAFSAKDALLVVDDFAPTSNQGDVDRAHREADRVLRAQGNRSGRLRMRGDGTLRAVKPPPACEPLLRQRHRHLRELKHVATRNHGGKAELRHLVAQSLALVRGPALDQIPGGIKRVIIVENAGPIGRQRGQSPPGSAIRSAHFQIAFETDLRKDGRDMICPVGNGRALAGHPNQPPLHQVAE